MSDQRRGQLHDAIQGAVDEGSLVIGWTVLVEVRLPDGQRMLSHRSGDLNGLDLEPWTKLGYLRSGVLSAESEVLGCTTTTSSSDEDDPED